MPESGSDGATAAVMSPSDSMRRPAPVSRTARIASVWRGRSSVITTSSRTRLPRAVAGCSERRGDDRVIVAVDQRGGAALGGADGPDRVRVARQIGRHPDQRADGVAEGGRGDEQNVGPWDVEQARLAEPLQRGRDG